MPLAGEKVSRRPVVVIIGPTAVGKTDTAIQVAQALGGEIISADSRQVYQYMDIGTAKPTPEQRATIPHLLIDVVTPDQNYTAVDFQTQAASAIDDILARGKLPFIVGGTGQYITALLEGWQFPKVQANYQLRSELEAYAETQGWEALLEKLRSVDPITAERIDGRNIRRVVRALEVSIESGRPFSELQQKNPPAYDVLQFGLTLADRAVLYERADRRIHQMVEVGLIDEVRALVEAGYTWNLSAMSGLGYLQIGYYLRGEMSLDEALIDLCHQTHAFIRRQYTWFRKYNPAALWLESNAEAAGQMLAHIQQWLKRVDNGAD
ncbi:MAG: tRNA (adenosine(37)-N6)-dimethylallyltransferase MiaA [Chloroflexi bacterium]|nr:tRNA (adenosine(37)-N6)-dimethylallyltransferase MiaA [Chloroflexota bacterium]